MQGGLNDENRKTDSYLFSMYSTKVLSRHVIHAFFSFCQFNGTVLPDARKCSSARQWS